MEENVNAIVEKMKQLGEDIVKYGNKSAERRSRKMTLELEKMFKQYRKESLAKE